MHLLGHVGFDTAEAAAIPLHFKRLSNGFRSSVDDTRGPAARRITSRLRISKPDIPIERDKRRIGSNSIKVELDRL
jgi:hypothetical protein